MHEFGPVSLYEPLQQYQRNTYSLPDEALIIFLVAASLLRKDLSILTCHPLVDDKDQHSGHNLQCNCARTCRKSATH